MFASTVNTRLFAWLLGLAISMTSTASLCADEIVRELDMRKDKAGADSYYVVFLARGASWKEMSISGHAYVALGKDTASAQACESAAFGVYPENGIGWIGPVPAKMVQDTYARSSHRLIVKVDKSVFDAVDQLRKNYVANVVKHQFQLGDKDCVTFVSAVAVQIRLKVLSRKDALLPTTFLEQLIEANTGKK